LTILNIAQRFAAKDKGIAMASVNINELLDALEKEH